MPSLLSCLETFPIRGIPLRTLGQLSALWEPCPPGCHCPKAYWQQPLLRSTRGRDPPVLCFHRRVRSREGLSVANSSNVSPLTEPAFNRGLRGALSCLLTLSGTPSSQKVRIVTIPLYKGEDCGAVLVSDCCCNRSLHS